MLLVCIKYNQTLEDIIDYSIKNLEKEFNTKLIFVDTPEENYDYIEAHKEVDNIITYNYKPILFNKIYNDVNTCYKFGYFEINEINEDIKRKMMIICSFPYCLSLINIVFINNDCKQYYLYVTGNIYRKYDFNIVNTCFTIYYNNGCKNINNNNYNLEIDPLKSTFDRVYYNYTGTFKCIKLNYKDKIKILVKNLKMCLNVIQLDLNTSKKIYAFPSNYFVSWDTYDLLKVIKIINKTTIIKSDKSITIKDYHTHEYKTLDLKTFKCDINMKLWTNNGIIYINSSLSEILELLIN